LARTALARARARSRKTERIARGIASFEADLVNTIIVALDKKVFVEGDAALWVSRQFNHPTTHTVGIKLLVPRGVKRVREINSSAVAAHFYHLRSRSEEHTSELQ